MSFILGAFIVLHGLVHLLYLGQSIRLFELRPGMIWPDSSWMFSRLLGHEVTRGLASIALLLAAVGFVAGGIGLLASQDWWRETAVVSAAFSTIIFVVFWDGTMHKLDDKGGIGVLINLAILVALLVLRWPDFDF